MAYSLRRVTIFCLTCVIFCFEQYRHDNTFDCSNSATAHILPLCVHHCPGHCQPDGNKLYWWPQPSDECSRWLLGNFSSGLVGMTFTKCWVLTLIPWAFPSGEASYFSRFTWNCKICGSTRAKVCALHTLLSFCLVFSLCHVCSSVSQSGTIIGPLSLGVGVSPTPSSSSTHAGYEIHQWPFGSSSGSSYTIWYSSRSSSSIQLPPVVMQAKTGHLFVHFDTTTRTHQYWMLSVGGLWEGVSKNAQYPLNPDRVLSFRSNGEPSWVMWATTKTSETRREKRAKSVVGWSVGSTRLSV